MYLYPDSFAKQFLYLLLSVALLLICFFTIPSDFILF